MAAPVFKAAADELARFGRTAPPGISAAPVGDDVTRWEVLVEGPPGTPYAAGVFRFSVAIPADYPSRPPAVHAVTRIYHPNIKADGHVCLELLSSKWNPSFTVGSVFAQIQHMFREPVIEESLVPEVARIYTDDRDTFNELAEAETEAYAKPPAGYVRSGAATAITGGGAGGK